MQRRNVGKAMYYLVAMLALVSAFALVACGGGDDDEGESAQTRTVSNQTVPVNSNTVQAVVGQQFTIPNGSDFSPGLSAGPATLTFNTPSTFTLTPSGGGTATGTVGFGSCSFTVSNSNIPGLPAGTSIPTFTTCNFLVNGTAPLTTGGGAGQATILLILGRGNITITASLPSGVTITIALLADGTLIINGVNTSVVPPPTTGATGTGGTQ
jgi:hypothetical protein